MSKKNKVPLSTTVKIETKETLVSYARERGITVSGALESIILEQVRDIKIEPPNSPSHVYDIGKIERRLESIETYVKYANYKINNLPCNYGCSICERLEKLEDEINKLAKYIG